MVPKSPEKQILPIAPPYADLQSLYRWSGDLVRTLQQNLSTIARKANDEATFVPTADLDMLGFSISNVNILTAKEIIVNPTAATAFIATWVDAGATGVDIITIKDSASPAAVDVLQRILAEGKNSSNALKTYGTQQVLITSPTAGAEGGTWELYTLDAGASGRRIRARQGVDFNGAADPGTGNIAANAIVLAGSITGATTLTMNGLLDNSGASGGQIKFPATVNPSSNVNTLDDFEENTWTPALTFTIPGNLSVAYTVQLGWYQKIGRFVSLSFQIVTSTWTHTTAGGTLQITGIPFNPDSSLTNMQWTGAVGTSLMTFGTGYTMATVNTFWSATTLRILLSGSALARVDSTPANWPTGSAIVLNGAITYITAT